MITTYPIHIHPRLGLPVVVAESPRLGGFIVRRDQFVWNGYFWEELPLPWYRRWAVAW